MPLSFSRVLVSLAATTFACAALHAANVRVYVEFLPGQRGAAQSVVAKAGGKQHYAFEDLNTVVMTVPEAALDGIERNPNVLSVEEDPTRGFLSQTVPYGVAMVQAPDAVAAGATGAGIKVGVIDSGVYIGHEDLQAVAITGTPDYGSNDQRTWYRDALSHGTHVVGTIAAANNDLGVVGVSPGAVSIYMVKVFGDTGDWIYSSDLLAAARAAASAGCKVISMSLGGTRSSKTEQQGFDDLYNNKGVLLVAAAGNAGNTAYDYPASYSSVVSVGAIDAGRAVAWFSQRNDQVELAAPGVAVLSTVATGPGDYDYFDGTSMATPHVAAAAALIWSKYPTRTNVQVRAALTGTAQDLGAAGRDTSYGYGLVQASAALSALANMSTSTGGGGTTGGDTSGGGSGGGKGGKGGKGGGDTGGGGGTPVDITAPVISSVSLSQNNKNYTFKVSWKTDEPATGDVQVNGTLYANSSLSTTHNSTFTGAKNTTFTLYVMSTDAAGNKAVVGPYSVKF